MNRGKSVEERLSFVTFLLWLRKIFNFCVALHPSSLNVHSYASFLRICAPWIWTFYFAIILPIKKSKREKSCNLAFGFPREKFSTAGLVCFKFWALHSQLRLDTLFFANVLPAKILTLKPLRQFAPFFCRKYFTRLRGNGIPIGRRNWNIRGGYFFNSP